MPHSSHVNISEGMHFHSSFNFINFVTCKFTKLNKNPVNQSQPTYYSKFWTSSRTLYLQIPPSLKFLLSSFSQIRKGNNFLSEEVTCFSPQKKKRLSTREWTIPLSKKSVVGQEVYYLWLSLTLDWLIIILYWSLYKILTYFECVRNFLLFFIWQLKSVRCGEEKRQIFGNQGWGTQ